MSRASLRKTLEDLQFGKLLIASDIKKILEADAKEVNYATETVDRILFNDFRLSGIWEARAVKLAIRDGAIHILADELERGLESGLEYLSDRLVTNQFTPMYKSLMRVSFEQVDWKYIAERILERVKG